MTWPTPVRPSQLTGRWHFGAVPKNVSQNRSFDRTCVAGGFTEESVSRTMSAAVEGMLEVPEKRDATRTNAQTPYPTCWFARMADCAA